MSGYYLHSERINNKPDIYTAWEIIITGLFSRIVLTMCCTITYRWSGADFAITFFFKTTQSNVYRHAIGTWLPCPIHSLLVGFSDHLAECCWTRF